MQLSCPENVFSIACWKQPDAIFSPCGITFQVYCLKPYPGENGRHCLARSVLGNWKYPLLKSNELNKSASPSASKHSSIDGDGQPEDCMCLFSAL